MYALKLHHDDSSLHTPCTIYHSKLTRSALDVFERFSLALLRVLHVGLAIMITFSPGCSSKLRPVHAGVQPGTLYEEPRDGTQLPSWETSLPDFVAPSTRELDPCDEKEIRRGGWCRLVDMEDH